jgi:hypothetical protein
MEVEEFDEILDELSKYLSSVQKKQIDRNEVFEALFMLLADDKNLEWEVDLWNLDATYNELQTLLLNFDFETLKKIVITDDEIIPEEYIFKRKVRIKEKGQIWVIHKNDVDPIPSNPHAHNLNSNIKLDLGNGDCFIKKKWVYNIGKKQLLSIREKAEKVFEGSLPKLKL